MDKAFSEALGLDVKNISPATEQIIAKYIGDVLTPSRGKIVIEFYGIACEKKTGKAIEIEHGVSEVQISQTLHWGLQTLAHPVRKRQLVDILVEKDLDVQQELHECLIACVKANKEFRDKLDKFLLKFGSIENLGLTVRAANCLKSENILTLADLVSWSEVEICKIPSLGIRSLNEIKEALVSRGLTLRPFRP